MTINKNVFWKSGSHLEFADDLRGRYLSFTSVLETMLSEIITKYFCNNDQRKGLFFTEIANGQAMSFSIKINILSKIIKKDYRDILLKYPDIIKRLNVIRDFRNKLAHAAVDLSEDALEKDGRFGVGFITFKNGKRHIKHVSLEDSINNYHDIAKVILILRELKGLL